MASTANRQTTAGSLAAFAGLLLAAVGPAVAQYPGHTRTDQQKKAAIEPRAVSVLEWVGEPGKPVASRLVPVAVFVDGGYQDGGLYLAQPEPLTVQTDTLYELEKAGVPQGTFYIAGGQDVGGAWFGYGKWNVLAAPKPVKKLAPSKVPPRVVQDQDPDRPHFKGGDTKGDTPAATTGDQSGSNGSGNGAVPSPSASDDPDKPTLHRRQSASSDSGTTAPAVTDSSSGNNRTAASGDAASPSADDDPDKPTLHRRSDTSSNGGTDTAASGSAPDDPDRPHLKKHSEANTAASAGDDGSPVSSVNEADPDRPKMLRGKPALSESQLEATKLTGMPADLQQMAAVSDPALREEHPFTYQWSDPGDAARMQTAIEALATKAVLAPPGAPIGSVKAVPSAHPATTAAHSRPARTAAPNPLPVTFSDEVFRAYELSYSGGATLVFTAKAEIGPDKAGQTLEKYVTIVAQPDFDGVPQVRLQSVTDFKHLDITPRMRLVDAVDTRGDNQADLIFELRRSTDRQFAIYRVRGLHAEQAFATASLPVGAPNHAEVSPN